jgi:hypothetical protein
MVARVAASLLQLTPRRRCMRIRMRMVARRRVMQSLRLRQCHSVLVALPTSCLCCLAYRRAAKQLLVLPLFLLLQTPRQLTGWTQLQSDCPLQGGVAASAPAWQLL